MGDRRTLPDAQAAGAPRTGRRRRSAGSRSPCSRVVLGIAVGTKKLTDSETRPARRRRREQMLEQARLQHAGDRERARPVADHDVRRVRVQTRSSRSVVQTLSRQPRRRRTSCRRSSIRTRARSRRTGTRCSSSSTSRARRPMRRTRSRRSSPRSAGCRRANPAVTIEEFGLASADYVLVEGVQQGLADAPSSRPSR